MTKLVMDCDPGWDDCLALLLLLAKRDTDVLGITTVWGNEDVQATTTNARRMTNYCGWGDLPIYVGCMAPLENTGMKSACLPCNVVGALPATGTVVNGTYAPDMLIDTAKRHGPELTILGIGSMTNLAVAVERNAAAMKMVGTLVITGGTFATKQNHEFNLGCDPRATKELLAAGLNPVIIPFDTEMTMNRGADAQKKMRSMGTKWATFYADVIDEQRAQKNKEANEGVFDQLAALYALDRSVFNVEQRTIRIEFPIGRIVDDPNGYRARIAASLNIDKAYELLFSRLA